ncbi:MAG TPA: DNA-processing protein DprA [Dehalococcoidia bacterium]|nr:DNA-processing protein DprA [Dehalococcoidia bacterium]
MSDTKYWVGFTLIPGIGRVRLSRLEQYFGKLERAWQASATELETAGLDSRSIEAVISNRPKISLDAEMEKLERYKVTVLTIKDEAYPSRLKEIYDPPPVLYIRGNLAPEDDWCLAVVGTRRPTYYGREVAEQIVGDLARNRITIVSGLAKGIDATAHRAALDSGGRSIAVFGCSLDIVYPREHVKLARQIMENGALISEFPLGTTPRRENFPLRNRIMSGLSLGVLVVEAGEVSGALITAGHALEQNREVFAIPGSVLSAVSRGTNRLIQEGAKLVSGANDILEELNLTMAVQQIEVKEIVPATETESIILQILRNLSPEPTHIDEVGHQSRLPIATVSSALSMMELKGMVKQVGGMNYIIAREARADYRIRVE